MPSAELVPTIRLHLRVDRLSGSWPEAALGGIGALQSRATPAEAVSPAATRRECHLRLPALLHGHALGSGSNSPELPPPLGPEGTAWRGVWSASGATENVAAAPRQGGLLCHGCSSAAGGEVILTLHADAPHLGALLDPSRERANLPGCRIVGGRADLVELDCLALLRCQDRDFALRLTAGLGDLVTRSSEVDGRNGVYRE